MVDGKRIVRWLRRNAVWVTSGLAAGLLVLAILNLWLLIAPHYGSDPAADGPDQAEADSHAGSRYVADIDERPWPLRHGDPENTDYLPIEGPSHLEPAWFHGPDLPIGTYIAVVGDHVVFHSYNDPAAVTTSGNQCHLWVLDRISGAVEWCTGEVRQTVTSPAIDAQNRIFISDGVELHAYTLGGEVLWRRPVENETSSVSLLPNGWLLVADYQGTLNAYRPDTGELAGQPFQLPAAANAQGEYANAVAPGMLGTGVDEAYLPRLISNYFGYGQVVQDMPAVSSASGRIFIASNSQSGETGALWAVDFDPEAGFSLACQASIGQGSDTSPAISHDGRTVYVAASGLLHAISASDCSENWQVERQGFAAASPSVAPDGSIYLLSGGRLSALRDMGDTAETLWSYDLSDDALALGFANGIFDSAIVVTERYAYATVSFGIQRPGYIIPFAHSLYVIDRLTGERVSMAPLGEESDSPPSMAADGWIYVPTKALARGHSRSMQILGQLPEGMEGLALREPMTGVYAFRPVGEYQP